MSSLRGTKSVFEEILFKKWFNENKKIRSVISKQKEGQKISSCKGTKTLWIKKQPKKELEIPFKRVFLSGRGTKRIVVSN